MMTYVKKYNILSLLTVCLVLSACSQESQMQRFERETRDYTRKNCPQRINDYEVLDSMVFHDDGTLDLTYYYSVVTQEGVIQKIQENKNTLREHLLESIRNSADMRHIRDTHLNVNYRYNDSETHEEILHLRFTPQDYE